MENESAIVKLLTEIRDDQRAASADYRTYMARHEEAVQRARRNALILMFLGVLIAGILVFAYELK